MLRGGVAAITTTLQYVMYDGEKQALVAQRKFAPFAAKERITRVTAAS